MPSENKKRKLKNSYGTPGLLKENKDKGPKRFAFYTPSLRKVLKRIEIE
jgi:hypothetical protein